MRIGDYLSELTHGPILDGLILSFGLALLVAVLILAFLPRRHPHKRHNKNQGRDGT